eukprot:gene24425-10024_t
MEVEKEQERIPTKAKNQSYKRGQEQPEPGPLAFLGRPCNFEQEQEQEMEIEKEQERIPSKAKNQSYKRDQEEPEPWPLASLGRPFSQGDRGFYPMSDFRMKGLTKTVVEMKFPQYMQLSRNYYKPSWGFNAHRAELKDQELMSAAGLTTGQDIFSMMDTDQSGHLDAAEAKQTLAAIDLQLKEDGDEELDRLVGLMDKNLDGQIDFEELKNAVASQTYYSIQEGRYFIILSLQEAESLRAAMHIARSHTGEADDPAAAQLLAGLTLRSGKTVLDSTVGFEPARVHQQEIVRNVSRYFDGEMDYSDQDVSLLIKALQKIVHNVSRYFDGEMDYSDQDVHLLIKALQVNPMKDRACFFQDTRSCRRREQKEWQSQNIAKLFASEDEFPMLQQRAAATRISFLMRQKGLRAGDLFMLFDHNGDRSLTPSELYGRFDHHGDRSLTPSELYGGFDHNGDRSLTPSELYGGFEHHGDRSLTPSELYGGFEHHGDRSLTPSELYGGLTNNGDRSLAPFELYGGFDHNGDGSLTPSELYGGVSWLGIQMTPARVQDLFQAADTDYDGTVTLKEFKAVLHAAVGDEAEELDERDEEDVQAGLEALAMGPVAPRPLDEGELAAATEKAKPPPLTLSSWNKFEAKMIHPGSNNLREVWSSRGTSSPKKLAIWSDHGSVISLRDVRVDVGRYITDGHDDPGTDKETTVRIFELRDRSVLAVQASKFSAAVRSRLMPLPIRYSLEFEYTKGEKPLYLWRPIPPSKHFCALGMMATNEPHPPPVSWMACVPVDWCVLTSEAALMWEMTQGSKSGAIWRIGAMGLLWATRSSSQPPEDAYTVVGTRIKLAQLTPNDLLAEQFHLSSK